MIEDYAEFFYRRLPNDNRGYIEGGILVFPEMLGISAPNELDDNDLYLYLAKYICALDPLANAQTKEDGMEKLKQVARTLEIDPEVFTQHTQYLYMLESLLQGKQLGTGFEDLKSIFSLQVAKAKRLLEDTADGVKPEVRSAGEKILSCLRAPQPSPSVQPQALAPSPIAANGQNFNQVPQPQLPQKKAKSNPLRFLVSRPAILTYALAFGAYTLSNTFSEKGFEE